jgi:hypothetical protein
VRHALTVHRPGRSLPNAHAHLRHRPHMRRATDHLTGIHHRGERQSHTTPTPLRYKRRSLPRPPVRAPLLLFCFNVSRWPHPHPHFCFCRRRRSIGAVVVPKLRVARLQTGEIHLAPPAIAPPRVRKLCPSTPPSSGVVG